jgi:hypothetical protein
MGAKSALLLGLFRRTLAPALDVDDDRRATTTSDNPDYIFIAVIDFLMLCVSWNQSKVARTQILPLGAIRTTDDGSMAFGGVDDGVWTCQISDTPSPGRCKCRKSAMESKWIST